MVCPSIALDTSLNTFLVNHVHLKDTKTMCREGGCGACIVSVKRKHPVSNEIVTMAVNSCLVLVHSCHNWEITTVSGLGNQKSGYHTLQSTLANFYGTQCGYCSPGMIMNMHSLIEEDTNLTMNEIENSFGGNICRCTGYRPILDAFKSLASDAEWAVLDKIPDIEDLDIENNCPKLSSIRQDMYSYKNGQNHLRTEIDDVVWYKVFSVKSILNIMQRHQGAPLMLVAGNTAQGAFRPKVRPQVYIDVNDVTELRKCSVDEYIVLGGNVTLTETMKFLKEVSGVEGYEYVDIIADHIDLIANVPVRNVGTIAGNLIIKHNHREFQSDIFLLFETVGAFLKLVGTNNIETRVTLSEFLVTDMRNKIIVSVSLPQISGNFAFKSYKIMPRAQNAHAYVNAGFRLRFNNETGNVERATLVYGGINPSFIHATKTEGALRNINIFDNASLRKVLKILYSEIQPDWKLPDACPEYRRLLAVCLFYKFILNTCPKKLISAQNITGSEILKRGLSSGQQKYETNKDLWPLQQPIPKIESLYQCAGEAEYIPYISLKPKELYASFVLAKKPLANIINIDPKDALHIDGVRAFYSAKDIPGKNSFVSMKMLLTLEDEELFCSGLVKYYGQPVGILVAENQTLAERAAQLVHIQYSNDNKPFYVDARDVLEREKNSPRVNFIGGYDATSKGTDIVYSISGSQYSIGQYHYTLETQSAVCIPTEDGLDLYPSSQSADHTQIVVSQVLNIPEHKINIIVRRCGGSFGSRLSRNHLVASACALAAYLLNSPVKIFMGMQDNMEVIGKRNCYLNSYEATVNKIGQIQSLKNDFYEDVGHSLNESTFIFVNEMFQNCYDNSPFTFKQYAVITEKPSSTWTRAPGAIDAVAVIENIMEHIAHVTGIDPLDVRITNMTTINNLAYDRIKAFREKVEYDRRRKEIDEYNIKNRWRKRGIAIIPMRFPINYYGRHSAMVCIFRDGSVAVSHAGVETGQGINTKVAQVCAYTLKLPLDLISIKPMSTMECPNSMITGGNTTSESCAFAAMKACETILNRLKPIRDSLGDDTKWEDLVENAYLQQIDLQAIGSHKPDATKVSYEIYGLSACEVEIDLLSGNVLLQRVDIQQETGESLSPEVDIGQIEGAFVMGLGYWLSEKIVYEKTTGELLTNRTWNYKPPGAKDIPVDFRIEFIKSENNDAKILRSKGTGEPSICMAFVAVCAIRHALQSARADANGGNRAEWFSLGAPTTPEEILLNANVDHQTFTI
ncbi:indole-3-acetaldehyde oxidase-like [Ctenocephalides felis]|uniref:indole-3-acetaldehyde oxidase-like n=1 Tax=Ctenocephalides felis TaxID=7515 RepID=UPI000E6E37F3|nr:indole-3-acetaldehyde oxidase-like [Ctenocephalides felis]